MKEVRTSLAEHPLQRETDGGDGTVERGTANVLPRRPIGMGEEFPRGGEGMNSIIAQDGVDIVVREAIAEACDRSRKRNQGDSQPWSEAEPLRLASFGWHRGVRFHHSAMVYDLEFQLVGGTGQAGARTA